MEGIMEGYANLMTQTPREGCLIEPNRTVARIVCDPDGSQRLVPSSTADPTSSEFQRLLGPQGSLANALGIAGVSPTSTSVTGPTGPFVILQCPTGPTACNIDPYFHFPDLEKDSGDCLYIPTFNDVPLTISMATYFAQAFLKEVSTDKILDEIDQDIKDVINKVVNANVAFNYVPIAVLLLVIIWVLVIHSVIDWQTGVFLTVIIVAVLWLGYLLLDTMIRESISSVATKTRSTVVDTFNTKNENIICNILKGYYTAVNHMILPEAAICTSPTGAPGPCDCWNSGITRNIPGFGEKDIKITNPAIIINDQIRIGGEERCNGINNNETLLPIIDKACPCIRDVEGFTLAGLSKKKKEDLFNCVNKVLNEFANNPSLKVLQDKIELCTLR